MSPERHGGSPRVALVHDWLTGMRGGEKVLEALAAFWPSAPIYTLLHLPGSVSPALEAHPIRTSFLQRAPLVRRRYRAYLPLFPAAIEDLDLSGYDLVVSSSHCVAKGIVPEPGTVHLCYCHTPMRYAWDQEHVYFPRRRGLVARLRNLVLTFLRGWDAAAVHRVDAFMANSHYVARRIRRFYGRDAEVVPPPVDTDGLAPFRQLPKEPPSTYALMVSALAPYKRIDLAIRACAARQLPLVVVGSGPERRRLERLAAPSTRFVGRVPAEELGRLYRGASLFLQPGLEDFGIASVEALAAGTPVVALGRGGVCDIVEDGVHGVLYDSPEAAPEPLGEAIDKALAIRFNEETLVRRAESFSTARFTERARRFLSRYAPAGALEIPPEAASR